MKFKNRYALCAAALVTFASCGTREIEISKVNESYNIVSYKANGQIVESLVKLQDERHKEITEWLRRNTQGWKLSLQDYAPKFLISNSDLELNFQKSTVILSVKANPKRWVQYEKPYAGDLAMTKAITSD